MAFLTLILLVGCERPDDKDKVPDRSVRGSDRVCPSPWFEWLGDLKDCATTSEPNDIDANGRKVVGNSSANEADVNDCVEGAHQFEAYGWSRPCEAIPFLRTPAAIIARPTGIIPLGYVLPSDPAESMARGISPDGQIAVGWSLVNKGALNEAVIFDMQWNKLRLGMPTGHQVSMASDASERFTGDPPKRQPGLAASIDRALSKAIHERIVVGYSSTGINHPSRTPGAVGMVWGPYASMMTALTNAADMPPLNAVEAVAVSDDGMEIGGSQYYGPADVDGGSRFKSIPISWRWDDAKHVYDPVALADLEGGVRDARIFHVSGDGRVLVGMGTSDAGQRACVWEAHDAGAVRTWSMPTALEPLPGMTYSIANGTDYFGSMVVGISGIPFTEDDVTQKATSWERQHQPDGSWGPWGPPQDIFQLFQAQGLATDVLAGHWTTAKRVSEFGRTITGFVDDNADGFVAGWVGALP